MRTINGRLAATQNALNASQTPPQCDLSLKYGEILLSMSVLLIFSSGIPALYWVGAIGFGLRYWVDKWFVLRICAKPPLYHLDYRCITAPLGRCRRRLK